MVSIYKIFFIWLEVDLLNTIYTPESHLHIAVLLITQMIIYEHDEQS